ncbi:MAG TPA: manganese efflux pump [Candidatus Onthocola stercorigallinarum]|nr:manganese efflux pump [Candidatus Onthocola stercorigallinarum]
MREIVSILLIGISLSMDTFSLSLTLGTVSENKLIKILPLFVGIFHFFMPLLGNIIGITLINLLDLASNIILGTVLIVLGINLAIHYFKDETADINLNILGIIIFALSVSIDSFSVGLGINDITNNYYIASIIFALCSAAFTYLGIIIGKYSSKLIGKYAIILGIFLLLILGIFHLFI